MSKVVLWHATSLYFQLAWVSQWPGSNSLVAADIEALTSKNHDVFIILKIPLALKFHDPSCVFPLTIQPHQMVTQVKCLHFKTVSLGNLKHGTYNDSFSNVFLPKE